MKTLNSASRFQVSLAAWLDRFLAAGILVFLVLLPFHLVIKQLFIEPIATYWKEGLLAILVLVWGVRCVLARRLLLTGTLLDWAGLAYAGLIVLRLVLDRSGAVGLWGTYISILYLPLFWLVPHALRASPRGLQILLSGLTIVGGLVALGGVAEFMLNRALFPSAEIILRQGYPDVFVYGTQLRRVYFVLDSPTTLANMLAILLPIALVQAFQARRLWETILYSVSAVLMFACILFTFSRGIWAALAITLVIVAAFKFVTERNRKFLLGMAGLAGAGLLIALAVLLSQPVNVSDQYTLELVQSEYKAVPLVNPDSLVDETPLEEAPEHQEWRIYDPIDRVEDAREVIFTHPQPDQAAEVIYRLTLPEAAALRFSIALSPDVWIPENGDGVIFQIFVKESETTSSGIFVFHRYLNPKTNPSDRRWRNYVLDLSAWAGQTVDLYLIAEAGPQHNDSYDWAGWADLDLGSLAQSYLAANRPAPQNPVAAHLASITNWAQDETNRDRLAAWNLGIAAWRVNPLWGSGLGVTGAASFRSMPEHALATESQVLKALVELGIPGLLAWGFLWFAIGQLALLAYRNAASPERKLLLLGLMGSLLVVFIEGLVYQNLEVKQVNAYFWTFVGLLAYLTPQPE